MARGDAQKVLDQLREELRHWPKPISQVEGKLGKAPGYFRGRWRAGSIPLDTLLETLAAIRENPVSFFSRALQQSLPHELDLMPPRWGDPPPIIARAFARLEAKTPATLERQHLESLDDLRYDDPERARRMAEDAIEFVDPVDLPLVLGIWASARRIQIRLEEGRYALRAGYEIARQQGNASAQANMVQRAAYLMSTDADYATALRLAERATILFLRLGDVGAVAKVLVDQGNFMVNLEEFEGAERTFHSALQLLPMAFGLSEEDLELLPNGLDHLSRSESRNLCAAHLGLAQCYFHAGEIDASAAQLERVKTLARSMVETGYGHWLEANILTRRGSWKMAEQAYTNASNCLLGISPIHAALVCCDQIRMQLDAGWQGLAHRTAFAMVRLLEPLEANRIAQSAIRDLICCQVDGHGLTPEFLDQIRQRIQETRYLLAVI